MQHTEYGRNDGGPHDRSEWCREEHGRFMQALELYGSRRTGEEWKHITDFIGSRTIEEVRLHGRQYLQKLVHQLPPSHVRVSPNRFLPSLGNQNDPNRHNYQVPRGIVLQERKGGNGNKGIPHQEVGSRTLSAAALECAQFMTVQGPLPFRSQSLYQQYQPGSSAAIHLRPKRWTFQEEKAFELALASWAGSKSYPWTKIAATVPGKTAKDVRHRFDEMVGEIVSIEAGEVTIFGSLTLPKIPQQQWPSSLSQRAVPPPPIEVSPRNVDKDGSATTTKNRRGSFKMLSPTFLDMLANEAENEEKSPLPAFPGLTNSPFPLFSPKSPGFFSPGNKKAAGQRDKKLSNVDDVKLLRNESEPTKKRDVVRRSSTPRIWNDFLAEELKLDDSLEKAPLHTRKNMLQSKSSVDVGNESTSSRKFETGADKQNVEMTDASAA